MVKEGGKGKAVHILHCWKDHLFDLGSKVDPPGIVDVVDEATEGREEPRPDSADGEDSPDAGATDLESKVGSQMPAPKIRTKPEPQLSKEGDLHLELCCQLTQTPSWIEVSDILRAAVLQAIASTAKSLTSSSFPIPSGTFYSSYILPFRPAIIQQAQSDATSRNDGTSPTYPAIDIKHSSYKSLATFLKDLDKQGILNVKDMKPEPLVLKVSVSHAAVTSHRLYTSLRDVQIKEEKREKKAEEERSRIKEMEVRVLWKVKPHAASGCERFFSEGGFE